MKNREYREHKGISRSQLNTILTKTPLHFKHELEYSKDDTPSLAFGRAAHKMVLEPDTFDEEFAVLPICDRRTTAGKQIYNEFIEQNSDKEIISSTDYEIICEMADAVRNDPVAMKYLAVGSAEQSYFWTDAETGEDCKVRPDWMTIVDGKNYIVDYKTTDSCQDGHFERSARKYGYKFQAGMYREGVFQNTFEDYGFVFIAQEKAAPYAVRVYVCTEEYINEGYDQFRTAIGLYHYCSSNDDWFGYAGPEKAESALVEEGE